MRKVILSMQLSLDGFVEGINGDMSWMDREESDQWPDLFEMLESVDLLLLGRGMWSEYRDYWKNVLAGKSDKPNEVAYAKLAERTKHIVFSKTLNESGWENTSINNGPLPEEIAKIKQAAGKDIQVVGGGKFAAAVVDAGLVDEYRLRINPVIIGGGKSFFHDQHSKQLLEFISSKNLPSGVVIVRYSVKR